MSDPVETRMERLSRSARLKSSGAVPDEWRQSLPIPVREARGLVIVFFFCPAQLSARDGQRVAPPDHVARIDFETGALVDLRAVKPSDFGQRDTPGAPIGAVALPPRMTAEVYLERRQRLLGLQGQLAAEFARSASRLSTEMRTAAREFRSLFAELREPPLSAYYEAIGGEFFRWIDENAR